MERVYSIFGHRFKLDASSAFLELVEREWIERRAKRAAGAAFEISVRNHEQGCDLIPRQGAYHAESFSLLCGPSYLATCDFASSPWNIDLSIFGGADPEWSYYSLLDPLLMFLLRRLAVARWHSAAVSIRGKGVLLAGPSGSGKSTTALALLTLGATLVSDDVVFLARRGQSVKAVGTERTLFLTDRSVAFFPELERLYKSGSAKRKAGGKHVFEAARRFPAAGPEREFPVRLVLFPTVGGSGQSSAERLSASDALTAYLELPQTILKPAEEHELLPPVDRLSMAAHLDLFAQLAKRARVYRLTLGSDMSHLKELLREIAAGIS